MTSLGVYIHVPFCLSKCGYCAFNSKPLKNTGVLDDYLSAVSTEIAMRQQQLSETELATIYFGGGTPSIAEPKAIGKLVSQVRAAAGSTLPEIEVTLEANPDTLDPSRLAEFREVGVNRLSLGVQSFDQMALAFLDRCHNRAHAESAYRAARGAGFESIGIDLIAGLPSPHQYAYRDDLKRAIEWRPEHLSVYLLSVEEPSALWRRSQRGELAMPTEDEQAAAFREVHDRLTGAGYEHYEVSNYALPGCRSKHNSRYWTGDSYLGFGAGAHSFLSITGQARRWANQSHSDEYLKRVESGRLPIDFEETITSEMAAREKIMLALRTSDGICPSDFGEQATILKLELQRMAANGWYVQDGDRFRPTAKGMLVADGAAQALWAALDPA
jgi:putative oxygen-independent coproporphyrinogen III oxidase